MIKIEITKQVATVYDQDGRVVNSGRRPQDFAFARNVANVRGYRSEEEKVGNVRTVRLWKPS